MSDLSESDVDDVKLAKLQRSVMGMWKTRDMKRCVDGNLVWSPLMSTSNRHDHSQQAVGWFTKSSLSNMFVNSVEAV